MENQRVCLCLQQYYFDGKVNKNKKSHTEHKKPPKTLLYQQRVLQKNNKKLYINGIDRLLEIQNIQTT
jgi:hypothetical protein